MSERMNEKIPDPSTAPAAASGPGPDGRWSRIVDGQAVAWNAPDPGPRHAAHYDAPPGYGPDVPREQVNA